MPTLLEKISNDHRKRQAVFDSMGIIVGGLFPAGFLGIFSLSIESVFLVPLSPIQIVILILTAFMLALFIIGGYVLVELVDYRPVEVVREYGVAFFALLMLHLLIGITGGVGESIFISYYIYLVALVSLFYDIRTIVITTCICLFSFSINLFLSGGGLGLVGEGLAEPAVLHAEAQKWTIAFIFVTQLLMTFCIAFISKKPQHSIAN